MSPCDGRPGPGKVDHKTRKHPHLWRPPIEPQTKNWKIFFWLGTTRLAESVEGLNTRWRIFQGSCGYGLLCRSVECCVLLRFSNWECWKFTLITVTHCTKTNKEIACGIICILCQQASPKRWLASVNMTSLWRHKQSISSNNDHDTPLLNTGLW